eukprot:g2834.t1
MLENEIVTPPVSMLSNRKIPANPETLLDWFDGEISTGNVSAAIVSLDMMLYGGLIASRSSNDTLGVVSARLHKLLKSRDRSTKLYLSTTVMRIPSYNGDFEEPWYWAQWGEDLYKYSYHKGRYDVLNDAADLKAYENLADSVIPSSVLNTFLWRRARNHNISRELLVLSSNSDAIETVYVNQDDSGEYGINVEEANDLSSLRDRLNLSTSTVKIYPGADEVGVTLLGRVLSDFAEDNLRPTVRVRWRAPNASALIPNYESRPVRETVRSQLEAAGMRLVDRENGTTDVVFLVNNFAHVPQLEASQQPGTFPPRSEYASLLREDESADSIRAFADVRYSNGGDLAFVDYLLEEVGGSSPQLIPGSFAYAGWNTDGNTLGTTAANAVVLWHLKRHRHESLATSRLFTLLRITEDVLYQSRVRQLLIERVERDGGDVNNLGSNLTAYESFCLQRLSNRSLANTLNVSPFPSIASVYFPWNRTFEIGFTVNREVVRSAAIESERCDVLIVGGSTAALAAAISASDDVPPSTVVCLTEPTDWLGGQLTSSLITAIDFGQHNRDAQHLPASFVELLSALGWPDHNAGNCWVSTICYEAETLLTKWILPEIRKRANLRVLYNTVPIEAVTDDAERRIREMTFVRRTRVPGSTERRFSDDVADWYDAENDSDVWSKERVRIEVGSSVIDGTEFGDVLVLSNASWVQGNEIEESETETRDQCGQCIVFPFYAEESATAEAAQLRETYPFSLDGKTWETVWSYRRVSSSSPSRSLIAWGGQAGDGNDFPYGYHFLSIDETRRESPWRGGLNLTTIGLAENYSVAFFEWYAAQQHPITMLTGNRSSGTQSGLSKMPYIRDTRRSIGLDGFRLTSSQLAQATRFNDRIGIGDYLYFDTHAVQNCPPVQFGGTLQPYFLPLRALTNDAVTNLVLAGKTMAQTNAANAATRLHPEEWVTGTAAGIFASEILRRNFSSTRPVVEECMKSAELDCPLQMRLEKISPLEWD